MAQERGQKMAKRRFKAEEIIMKMREVEVHQGKGMDLISACKQAGITDVTYYRWRKKYGGMKIDQAKKYKEMEKENGRLKKLVADQALDIAILKEAAQGNF
jgi:spore maturation protein CgeB